MIATRTNKQQSVFSAEHLRKLREYWSSHVARSLRSRNAKKQWADLAYREKKAAESKLRWSDPLFKEKMRLSISIGSKNRFADPAQRKAVSDRMRRRWAENPVYRKKQAIILKRLSEDPALRRKHSRTLKRQWLDPAFRKMRSLSVEQQWLDPIFRQKIVDAVSKAAKRKWLDPEHRRRQSTLFKQIRNTPEFRARQLKAITNPEHLKKLSKIKKELWQSNPAIRRKIVRALAKRPTAPESTLNRTLQILYPREFKYNGVNAGVMLGGYIPDFVNVNGKKQVIELFGCYWHGCKACGHDDPEQIRKDRKRVKSLQKLGWESLIVWQHELNDAEKLETKIAHFVGGGE